MIVCSECDKLFLLNFSNFIQTLK